MQLSQELKSIPNMLSILRLLLVPVFLWLLIVDQFLIAFLVLMFASFTDWLDGFIARKFNQITSLGKVLDPSADRLFILATLIGLTVNEIIPAWLAIVIVARDILLLVGYPISASHGYGPLPVHFLGKAATFALLYALPLLLLADVWPSAEAVILPLAWGFAYWGIGLYWVAGFVYLAQLRQLISLERRSSPNI
ncbi:MAG: CDP-alcohol phosphatidyltransferase family protein [Aquiluna sp.]|jgi:cardiolipin synthase|nr:CDP-alcohol phosphatidyltransferase family protein [Actinomycetota bacterium]NCV81162.1 CDP-alcohol phosphatidyltransferase family protein [Actinomycetota bacterium]NCV98230.1 CDP-alcohol phosphatidyltransferase family protein [Actinomycetota bacterium]NCW22679.1 CDP-alcohol phosphatidyltransferase family protein [Actinomycetota bacterium]NCW29463.1 CDP-alcohol phosphatidyltransferase family protein [Actinomycetota bacterium]